jgi:hypothetical protein
LLPVAKKNNINMFSIPGSKKGAPFLSNSKPQAAGTPGTQRMAAMAAC